MGCVCPGVHRGALQGVSEVGLYIMTTGYTHCFLCCCVLAVLNFRVSRIACVQHEQPLSYRLSPAPASGLVTLSNRPIIKVLADALDSAAPAAVAYGFVGRRKCASDLPPLALPAALGASANLPPLERGRLCCIIHTCAGLCHFPFIYKGILGKPVGDRVESEARMPQRTAAELTDVMVQR